MSVNHTIDASVEMAKISDYYFSRPHKITLLRDRDDPIVWQHKDFADAFDGWVRICGDEGRLRATCPGVTTVIMWDVFDFNENVPRIKKTMCFNSIDIRSSRPVGRVRADRRRK